MHETLTNVNKEPSQPERSDNLRSNPWQACSTETAPHSANSTYPNTAGNAVKQIIAPVAAAHAELSTKYIELVQEIMKLPDVHFSIKMAILPGRGRGVPGSTRWCSVARCPRS